MRLVSIAEKMLTGLPEQPAFPVPPQRTAWGKVLVFQQFWQL
jgi:hypothetical protein